jgi:CRP-like cAMP-binding protein/tRNA A-37 threonylcarbamoyl transferase component Bud32
LTSTWPYGLRGVVTAHPDEEPPSATSTNGHSAGESAQRPTMASPGHRADAPPPSGKALSRLRLDVDRYTHQEKIGEGGSSVVIRAFDNEILREVAIKILSSEIANDSPLADRFAQEARINGQLEHPSIVPVYDLGIDRSGRRFLSAKLIEGKNLEEELKELGPARLEPVHLAELLQVFVKVCDAVSFAHSRGVIHRDLKPKNIMVSDFGQVYVVDWGTALVLPRAPTEEGARVRVSLEADHSELDPPGLFVGTSGYAPPEQMRGQNDLVNERTDVFALGATLYQILTGKHPSAAEIRGAAVTRAEKLVPGGLVPHELSRIAMKALAHEPADRYQSVAQLKQDIESLQRGAWDLPRVALPAGSSIIAEGEPGDAAYVILEGSCVAYRVEDGMEDVLRVMGPGEVFGEMAVFDRKPRSASVKAQTDVALVKVTSDVLWRALGLNSWMGAFVRALAERFRDADQRLRAIGRTSWSPGPPPSWQPAGYSLREVPTHPASLAEPTADMDSFRPRASFPAGTTILAAGESRDTGYVVLRGRCVEYLVEGGQERVMRDIEPRGVFGEVSVFSGRPSPVSVRAATDVELLAVSRDVLSSSLGLTSWMGTFVIALASRLSELEERLRGRETR